MDDMGVSLGLVVAAVVATTVVFILGLAVCMVGFRKYGREDAH
jgi:predicted permease